MGILKSFLFKTALIISVLPLYSEAQFLSNLNASKNDALFTTYAAPQSRSSYKNDQGYSFSWTDEDNGAELISSTGLNLGFVFSNGKRSCFNLKESFKEPIVTTSYSDVISYYYYPFRNVRVKIIFDVYSSTEAIVDIQITNESDYSTEVNVSPYLYYPGEDSLNDIQHQSPFDFYSFPIRKNRDNWMKEHSIPLTEDLIGFIAGDILFDSAQSFVLGKNNRKQLISEPFRKLKEQIGQNKRTANAVKGIIFSRNFRIYPGDRVHFRMVFGLEDQNIRIPDLSRKIQPLFSTDLNEVIKEDQLVYSKIPTPPIRQIKMTDNDLNERDLTYLYWSCFSLLRQCMMTPEGKCTTNYYVFSREPKWGWGYGGQVFHESLSMLAYAYMDPEGAMNSQRVYFNRQQKDGYINYRTGPYLDESIETNGKLTTSAPFFNYENLEIYKVTHNKPFLEDAYNSGEKFYQYYIATRDSNHNGLCEWGGEASLESVRDARVAVWDNVGWPSNFKGPDLNSMLVKEARSLSEMASLLGRKEEAAKWNADAEVRSSLINKILWDNESGFYYNVNRNDHTFIYKKKYDLKIKEIIGFLPLWAGISDSAQTSKLVSTMLNPDEFWRPFGIPTLSAADKYYNPMGYWNGPVWVQWDYLVFRGLLDHGYKKEAKELTAKVLKNMIWHLKQDHVFWEFYSPDDHQAGWNKTYIWASLAARFIIDLQD